MGKIIPAQRRHRILDLLRQGESLTVKDISGLMGVSLATVRRDLDEMGRKGLVERTHGGAVLTAAQGTTFEPPYAVSSREALPEKEAIARAAVESLNDGQSVILDSGSTVMELARCILHKGLRLTIVTNDILLAGLFSNSAGVRLIVPGGTLRVGSPTLLGEPGLGFVQSLNVDAAYIGIHAIDGRRLCDTTIEVALMKRRMVAAARRTVLLADSSKFGRTAFCEACDIGDVAEVVTDRKLSPEVAARYEDMGLTVTRA